MTSFSFAMLVPMMPELFLAVAGLALLVLGAFSSGPKVASHIGWLTILTIAITAALLIQTPWNDQPVMNGMFVLDGFAGFVKLVLLGGIAVSLILSLRYMEEEGLARFEYPILVLFSGLGMMMMVSASNLLSLYMGLELQSLAIYVLASFRRDSAKSAEAGLKYFVLGALASGLLLFGISLVYGYTGSIDFGTIGGTLGAELSLGAIIGMVFIVAGLAFKISAAPFHMWTPDVYEGAPTSVTAFFAMVPKLAAIALLSRLCIEVFPAATQQMGQIIWMLAAATMAVGAFAGLLQDNVKRLLAYSSIGNMGFALVGLASMNATGIGSVLFYMVVYMIMTAGTFAIVLSMRRNGKSVEQISDLAGLSRTSPFLAYSLAIMMFSMSGIPPLAGFFSKLVVFKAAIGVGLFGLAVFGVLCSVVAAYYYLRIIKVMFFDEPAEKLDDAVPLTRRLVILASVAFVVIFIVYPSPLMETSTKAGFDLINAR